MFVAYLGSGVFVKERCPMIEKRGRSKLIMFSLSEKGYLQSLMRDLSLGWDLSLTRRKMCKKRRKINRSKKSK